MTNTISFMTANFVARELNYHMTKGWSEGDTATAAFFRPIETYAERMDAMLTEITGLGFKAIDLWSGHLDPNWATDRHLEIVTELLARKRLTVSSLATYVTDADSCVDRIAVVAKAVGTRVIGSGCLPDVLAENRSTFVRSLEKNDLIFGFENHPEKTPSEVLSKLGDSADGRLGVALDTGWFGTQGYSVPQAIKELGSHLVHVHLKDIYEPEKAPTPTEDIRTPEPGAEPTLKGMGHETCTLGDGVVDIPGCIAALREIGYAGDLSIEHEPEEHSPINDVKLAFERLQTWMRSI